MAEFRDYQPREQLPNQGPAPDVRPIPIAPVPASVDLGAADRALSGFGQELAAVSQKLQEGQQHVKASQGMEAFLGERAQLQQKYTDDTDFATAETRFAKDIAGAKMRSLADITDTVLRQQTSLQMERAAISSQNDVRTAQVARQADITVSGLDTFKQTSLNEAVTAASPTERASAIDRYGAEVQRAHAAGWIDATTATKRVQVFGGELDQADAMALVQKNPAAAIGALRNPQVFASLDPVRRESLIIAATQGLDGSNQASVVNAAAFHPEAASLAAGRVIAPEHAQKVFDNGILAIETSGRDNSAVSPKGALGVSQIMPGTARDVATALGLKDVAALSDDDLKKRLLADQPLNVQLGRAYWQQMVTRYDGSLPLAAAAYNAGPGRADQWKAAAEQKFGANYSPAQLASIVDIKETRDYLGELYGTFNAPMNVAFSTPTAALQAGNAVGAVLAQQETREKHLLSVQATAGNASDPVADVVKAGFSVDPMRVANFRTEQTAAAAKGDAAAAGRLRDLDFAEKTQPLIRQAWSMPPQVLDAGIKTMEAQITLPGANATQSGINTLNAFKAVRDAQVKARDSEPVTLGAENGGRYYALQPIDPEKPLDEGALKNRDSQALTAHKIYGGTGSPFTAQEAEAWHQKYADSTPADRAAIVGQFAKGFSPTTFAAALPQIVSGTNAKNDRPGIMMAAGLYGSAPEIASTILQGIDAQKAEARYVPEGTNKLSYQTSKDTYLPAAAFNVAARTDPKGPMASMQDAIDARYAFLSAQAKDLSGSPNSSRLKQAVDDVTGGILLHNGAPVIAPARGMTQRQFDGVLWGVTTDDLKAAQTTSGKPIDADFLRGSAKLVARADGQYYLQVNRDDAKPQYAVTKAGGPFVLDLRGRQPGAIEPMDPLAATALP